MGMDAELIAIGPYSLSVVDCLAYGREQYEQAPKTKPGTKVVTTVVSCDTSGQSHQLAELLGMEPWDFNTHHLDNRKAKKLARKLRDMLWDDQMKLEENWRHDALTFIDEFWRLSEAGFEFFYLPNG